jgi:hypothetical protein
VEQAKNRLSKLSRQRQLREMLQAQMHTRTITTKEIATKE